MRRTIVTLVGGVLALQGGTSCAVGAGTDGGNGEASVGDVSIDARIDAAMDVPVPMDVFACTGTTCSVPNGTGVCTAGVCQVGTCTAGGFDMDHNARNGCECVVGVVATTCAAATDLGTLPPGSMHLVQSLLPPGTTEQWTRVTFAAGGREHVEFLTNPGSAFRFDVQAACTPGSLQCPDRPDGGGSALTAFEFLDTAPDAGATHTNEPARMNPVPTTVYIRVTTSRASTTCEPYTLVVGNDVW
ncbi:MAG: hypothetical protein WCJ30_01160 [Deltaproteobacteria bacterium]